MRTKEIIVLTVAVLLAPTAVVAGGYGTAGVMDESVGQASTAEATVWCPRLREEIPERLQLQMDCGSPAIAGGQRRGIFSAFRHIPQGNRSNPRDGYNNQPNPIVAEAPNGGGSSPVDKTARLDQLGLTLETIQNQSTEFQREFNDYYDAHGADGDWSGYNPN